MSYTTYRNSRRLVESLEARKSASTLYVVDEIFTRPSAATLVNPPAESSEDEPVAVIDAKASPRVNLLQVERRIVDVRSEGRHVLSLDAMFAVVAFDDFALSSFTSQSPESSERSDIVLVRSPIENDLESSTPIDAVGVLLFEFFESRENHFRIPFTIVSVEVA